jgi:uncharacterized protein (TIGR00255 family)
MLAGMTGYGNVQFYYGQMKGFLEIKSQNHRYLDFVCYLPVGYGTIENKIKSIVQKEISRGRVTVSVKITEKSAQNVQFNQHVVQEYLKEAKKLQKDFSLDNSLTIANLVALPGVVETKDAVLDVDKFWSNSLSTCLQKAMKSLMTMRKSEGKSLEKDIAHILKRMTLQINNIESRTKTILRENKKILSPEEFTSFQKGCEINEEITRLKHYVEEYKLLLKSQVPVGKKMDFIAQEMQRETNTIGSKLQDQIVSNSVIALKSKIERLREQAQNIE